MDKKMDKSEAVMPSLFKSYRDKTPGSTTWEEVHRLITSGYLRENTEKYRYYREHGMDKDAGEIKSSSYGITPAVVCSGGRCMKHITAYTLFSLADFDDLPADDLPRCMALLAACSYTFLAYITISGRGIRVIFRVDAFGNYVEAFRRGNEYFSALIGYAYDPACKDPVRLSGLCHDPHAHYNPAALPLHIETAAGDGKKSVGRPRKIHHVTAAEAAPAVLSRLAAQDKIYEPGRHNEFVSCAVYLMNSFGVAAGDTTGWVRAGFPDFDAAALESIVRSVYQHTEEHGTKPLPKEKREGFKYAGIDEMEAFILTQAKVRHNVITDRAEICMKGETEFRDLTDRDENTIWRRAGKTNTIIGPKYLRLILNSEFVPDYNPFIDYFDHLPEWDGTTDYIGELTGTVQTTTPEMFRSCFRKWFVAILAAIIRKKVVNHEILVFIGEQGAYKTTWFNSLLPPQLEQYFYTKVNSNRMTKDDQFTLAEFGLICFEEIDSMRPSDLNQLKAMITMPTINERAAYAHNKSHRPHIASFCGTGNNLNFLSDPTGNRRWLPFEVKSIVDPHTYQVNYEGVYSQALYLFRHKFCYWFTKDEIKQLNRHNERFEVPNLEEELIRTYYRKPRAGEMGVFISTAEILQRINALIKIPLSATKIGIIMRKMEFECRKNNGNRGYRVIKLDIDEMSENKLLKSNASDQKLPF